MELHESISGHVLPREPFEDFPYDAIDGEQPDEPQGNPKLKALVEMVKPLFKILDQGNDPKGIAIRLQAMKYLLGIRVQPALATEIGVTKAAISKVAIEIAREFGIELHSMRGEETCEKFSEQTKARHEEAKKRKAESLRKHQEFVQQYETRRAEVRKCGQLNPNIIQ